ncbi:dephospho-CoA kinase [Runella sp. MFBS21]|uniref:dephospho-CoA kinase n=1 Tax=Runella sp. MFBS21 TaxID=3034018 RepID=UPI0023F694BE|nr:dephospho-CoA kinase [Runella sp. MFBS21]MDF7820662.1 dephospho-CoA kinase [Runella sp. MFBS21]
MALQIGITGGIGSGKSLVCRVFGALGVPVYSADERAKWLLNHDPKLRKTVEALLGNEAYTAEGSYNRQWVAGRVFQNPVLLRELNAVVHPRVGEDTLQWMETYQNAPYVVKEAAIMSKAGSNNSLDKVVVVQAPVDLRVKRVQQRDPHRSETEIRDIINRQVSEEERLKIADFVIHNDEQQLLLPKIWQLHELFSQQK